MRDYHSTNILWVLVALLLLLTGCSKSNSPNGDVNSTISKKPTSIEIQSDQTEADVGKSLQLTVIIKYEDGSSEIITSKVNWASENGEIATVSDNGSVTTKKITDQLKITATYDDYSADIVLKINPTPGSEPNTLAISADTLIEKDQTFTASVTFSDGAEKEVQGVVNEVINENKITVKIDNVFFEATSDTSNNKSFALTEIPEPAVLTEISISLSASGALTEDQQIIASAKGIFDDNSEIDPLVDVVWSSEGPISISDTGEITAQLVASSQNAKIIATKGDVVSNETIVVNPPITITAKSLQQIIILNSVSELAATQALDLDVKGVYDDNSEDNPLNGVTWVVVGTGATIDTATGNLVAENVSADSNIVVTASKEGISESINITIKAASTPSLSLKSITINSNTSTLQLGQSISFSAAGLYSDDATTENPLADVVWSVDNAAATINPNSGELTANSVNTNTIVNVKAAKAGVENTFQLTITPPTPTLLESLSIQSNIIQLTEGESTTFSAVGSYSNGNNNIPLTSVNWSTNSTAASINPNNGLLIANLVTQNTEVTVTGIKGDAQDTYTFNVVPPAQLTIIEISVANDSTEILGGSNTQLFAKGIFDDNNVVNSLSGVLWSTDSTVAAINLNTGAITTSEVATETVVTFTASKGTIETNINITLLPPPPITLDSLVISSVPEPEKSILVPLETLQLIATANYSDNSSVVLAQNVSWTSSNPEFAEVDPDTGFVSAKSDGVTNIVATFDDVQSDIYRITVETSQITSIEIVGPENKPNVSMLTGENVILSLIATYDNGSQLPINSGIDWSSTNETIASVNSAGLVTSFNLAGNVIIQARHPDFAQPIGFTIRVSSNTELDNFILRVNGSANVTHIEDGANNETLLSAFFNPVGIAPGFLLSNSHPGFFVTLFDQFSKEKLLLATDNNTIGSYDKTTASISYQPDSTLPDVFTLDETDNTNIEITINEFGAEGERATGSFTATLCQIGFSCGALSTPSNLLTISGSFYITVDGERSFISHTDSNNPILITTSVLAADQQIASGNSSYYYMTTTPGIDYQIMTQDDNAKVTIGVYTNVTYSNLIDNSVANTEQSQQELIFKATTDLSFIKFDYLDENSNTVVDNGTTFSMLVEAQAVTAEGNAGTPFNIGGPKMPIFYSGQVDDTESYYELDVYANHRYIIESTLTSGSPVSISIANVNSPGSYTVCDGANNCVITASDAAKLFVKVNGAVDSASFKLTIEYHADASVTLSPPVDNYLSQVSYHAPVLTGNNNFWINGLNANTYYLISLSGITGKTDLWINDFTTLNESCGASGNFQQSPNTGGDINVENIYCIVKTKAGISQFEGFAVNIVSDPFEGGTPFTLNIHEVSSDNVYYVSTFRTDERICDAEACIARTFLDFYRPGANIPFTYTVRDSINPFAQKAILLNPGESVYIRAYDFDDIGAFYSMVIRSDAFRTLRSLTIAEDPDQYEFGNGDNTQATATPIDLNEIQDHSFSRNTDINGTPQFGDEDWFIFTAPATPAP